MKTNKGSMTNIFRTQKDNRAILVRLTVGLIFFNWRYAKNTFSLNFWEQEDLVQLGFGNPAFWAYFTATFENYMWCSYINRIITRIAFRAVNYYHDYSLYFNKNYQFLYIKVSGHGHMSTEQILPMTLLLLYILIYGSGNWSVDSKIYGSPETVKYEANK